MAQARKKQPVYGSKADLAERMALLALKGAEEDEAWARRGLEAARSLGAPLTEKTLAGALAEAGAGGKKGEIVLATWMRADGEAPGPLCRMAAVQYGSAEVFELVSKFDEEDDTDRALIERLIGRIQGEDGDAWVEAGRRVLSKKSEKERAEISRAVWAKALGEAERMARSSDAHARVRTEQWVRRADRMTKGWGKSENRSEALSKLAGAGSKWALSEAEKEDGTARVGAAWLRGAMANGGGGWGPGLKELGAKGIMKIAGTDGTAFGLAARSALLSGEGRGLRDFLAGTAERGGLTTEETERGSDEIREALTALARGEVPSDKPESNGRRAGLGVSAVLRELDAAGEKKAARSIAERVGEIEGSTNFRRGFVINSCWRECPPDTGMAARESMALNALRETARGVVMTRKGASDVEEMGKAIGGRDADTSRLRGALEAAKKGDRSAAGAAREALALLAASREALIMKEESLTTAAPKKTRMRL